MKGGACLGAWTTCESMGKKLNSNLRSSGAAAARRTVFETVSLSSDSLFQRAVSILHTSYLDSASEHGFQYSQVTLVKNDIFLNEYKTFYQEKKANNYTQEELQETYGFLLFETENQIEHPYCYLCLNCGRRKLLCAGYVSKDVCGFLDIILILETYNPT